MLLLAACFVRVRAGGAAAAAVAASGGARGIGRDRRRDSTRGSSLADLRYGLDTDVALQNKNKVPQTLFATPNLLLNPFRPSAHVVSPYARDLRYTLPWMFALWAVVIAVVMWRHVERFSKRAFIGVLGVALVYVVLITWQTAWNVMPHVLYNVQFPSRLHAYVLIATALLVMLALRVAVEGSRPTATHDDGSPRRVHRLQRRRGDVAGLARATGVRPRPA